jgi:hypothetical protein
LDLLRGASNMKFYYAISVLVQLLLALFSGDKNKVSYMLYLCGSLFEQNNVNVKNNKCSDSASDPRKTKTEIFGDKYSYLLER